jgi:hypothetical protein
MGKKDPVKDREALREDEPEVDDDLETAQAKSGSVDERIPERFATDEAPAVAGTPAMGMPQAGVGLPGPGEDLGEGERVLEQERKAQRTRKSPG